MYCWACRRSLSAINRFRVVVETRDHFEVEVGEMPLCYGCSEHTSTLWHVAAQTVDVYDIRDIWARSVA